MKHTTRQNSFLRRPAPAWVVAAVALSLVSSAAFAQSGATGTGTGTTQSQTDRTRQSTQSGQAGQAGQTGQTSQTDQYGTGQAGAAGTAAYGADRRGSMNLERSDRRFIEKAAELGQKEVAIAQLASQRASNTQLRSLAQQLASDHTRMNSELMTIARNKNVNLDQEAFDTNDRAYRRLSDRSGQEFDKHVAERLIDHHEDAIKLFQEASQDARDPEVRAFASKHVGSLRQHLQQVQTLQRSIDTMGDRQDMRGTTGTTGTTGAHGTGTATGTATGTTTTTPQYGTGGTTGAEQGTGTPGSNRPSTTTTGPDRR